MRIRRWLGFEVTENWQARDLRLTRQRPPGLAVQLDITIPDSMLRQVVEAHVLNPEEISLYIPAVEVEGVAVEGQG